MQSTAYFFCFIHFLSAMGYSIIAPIYPPIALKRISVSMCGLVLGIFAFLQSFSIIITTSLIVRFGRKKLYIYSILIEGICCLLYAVLDSIDSPFFFLSLSLIIRIIHGFVCGLINVISYSLIGIMFTGEELQQATGYMELGWSCGSVLAPVFISIFYYIGGYPLPFIVTGFLIFIGLLGFAFIPIDYTGNENNNLSQASSSKDSFLLFLNRMFDQDTLYYTCIGMFQMNSMAFYFPTLTNYLKDNFGVPLEKSSLLFIIPVVGYIISLKTINDFIGKYEKLPLVIPGFLITAFGIIFIGPAGFLPYSIYTMCVGLFIIGWAGSMLIIPAYLLLSQRMKEKSECSEAEASDQASALFNLSFNLGDFWSPVLGAYVTAHKSFQWSSYVAAMFNVVFTLAYYCHFKTEIHRLLALKNQNEQTNNLIIN